MDFPDVVQLAVPFFIVALLVEIAALRFFGAKGSYETRDTLTSLLMGAGNVVVGIALGFVAYGFFQWLWQFRVSDLGTSAVAILICFILDDLRYYWVHRIGHRCRWVWASHVNHHSSQHYNLSTALRQTWTGTLTFMMVLQAPLILIGFSPELVLFCGGLNLVYQFWIHTEAIGKMPRWFEAVMNTPSHHRVHHGRNPRYLDANYAGTLIVWDRLFGTFVPEQEDEAVEYGLVRNIATYNPLRVALHEWIGLARDVLRRGIGWRARLAYMFAPPGWSHDGSRQTSEDIKHDYVARHPEKKGMPGL
jgi:sterol desaturase/sphingolipid hydroxylase (fatty acid hydroxylase superfamily)